MSSRLTLSASYPIRTWGAFPSGKLDVAWCIPITSTYYRGMECVEV